jgi:hypothetical protein
MMSVARQQSSTAINRNIARSPNSKQAQDFEMMTHNRMIQVAQANLDRAWHDLNEFLRRNPYSDALDLRTRLWQARNAVEMLTKEPGRITV